MGYRMAVALIAALTAVSLSGCGSDANNENEKIVDEVELTAEMKQDGTFCEGIFINGIAVGTTTYAQAESRVRSALEKDSNFIEIELQYDGKSWMLAEGELKPTNNLTEVLDEAFLIDKGRSNAQNKKKREEIKENKHNFSVKYNVNLADVIEQVNILAKDINREAEDAYAKHDPESGERFTYIDGTDGIVVKVDETANAIMSAFERGSFPAVVPLSVSVTPPKVTVNDVKNNTSRISVYTTSFSSNGKADRVHNLKLGCEKLNGFKIRTGEKFSFNDVVGPRDEASGWRKAATIVGGNMFEDDWGGGVCQVSTTLYNAVLEADLPILKRSRHSIPSSYVPYGLDATVAYGSKDFHFKNDKAYPIYIFANVSEKDSTMSVSIYGPKPEPDKKIKISSKIIEEKDPPEPEIIYDETVSDSKKTNIITARKGYTVEVYKTVTVGGEVVDTSKIYTDVYEPKKGVISIGTKRTDSGSSSGESDETSSGGNSSGADFIPFE